jgi:hypothetical protein
MKIHARITLKVEFIRGYIFIFYIFIVCVNTIARMINTNVFFESERNKGEHWVNALDLARQQDLVENELRRRRFIAQRESIGQARRWVFHVFLLPVLFVPRVFFLCRQCRQCSFCADSVFLVPVFCSGVLFRCFGTVFCYGVLLRCFVTVFCYGVLERCFVTVFWNGVLERIH